MSIDGTLKNGISALTRTVYERAFFPSLFSAFEDTLSWQFAVQKRVLTRTWPSWHPGIRFPASRIVRKKILLFISYPVYGTYLGQNIAGISRWFSGKESTCQCRRCGLDLCVRMIPWRRKWQSTPVFLPGESHGQRSLAGYSPWGHKELDTVEWLTHTLHL